MSRKTTPASDSLADLQAENAGLRAVVASTHAETKAAAAALLAAAADLALSRAETTVALSALTVTEKELSLLRDEVAIALTNWGADAATLERSRRLSAGVAHDINNVLQTLLGCIELAKDDISDRPDAIANLDIALRAGQHGARLSSQLLSLSSQQLFHPTSLAVSGLLWQKIDVLRRTLGQKIIVSLDIAPDLPLVFADAAHLEAVFLNLAMNARDAMPQGGNLRIEARTEGDLIMISFADTGQGMTPEVLELACEPFFTTKGPNVSGLGLAMAQRFACQSGGELRIDSAPGRGTRIAIALPAVRNTVMPTVHARHAAARGRVLVVDDDRDTARVAAAFLRQAGFDVTTVGCSDDGLSELRAGLAFDVLVADYAMAGMDGVDLVVCARELYPMLPALIVTGYGGADGLNRLPPNVQILSKPFQRNDLVRAVTALARTRSVEILH